MTKPYLTKLQLYGLLIGIIGSILLYLFPIDPSNMPASMTAAVVFLMAAWWLTEAVPLSVTSLLPLLLFPLLGVLNAKDVSSAYINNIIFLFIGAFMLSLSVERWNLHKRISIKMINLIGGGPERILFALMLSTWFLSMFINNTSTTMLMLPIALSIILQFENLNGKPQVIGFAAALLLGVAYASSVGGVATLVGTVPNLVFVKIFQSTFPLGPKISFATWMMAAMPISAVLLVLIWMVLKFMLLRKGSKLNVDKSFIENESKKLGKMTYEENVLTFLLFLVAFLWIFRVDLELGFVTIPGWSNLLTFGEYIDDSSVAVFVAVLLFFIPSRNSAGNYLADVTVIRKVPWDVIILFGGGFAIADAFQSTGLASIISSNLTVLGDIDPIFMLLAICGLLTFLTELTSNTATTQTVLPILAATAVAMQINPLLLMIPATISASMAFMLPVATPPNAIIFGTGRVKIYQMARVGLVLNFIGIVVISLMFYFLGMLIFDITPGEFPFWGLK